MLLLLLHLQRSPKTGSHLTEGISLDFYDNILLLKSSLLFFRETYIATLRWKSMKEWTNLPKSKIDVICMCNSEHYICGVVYFDYLIDSLLFDKIFCHVFCVCSTPLLEVCRPELTEAN